MPEYQVITTNSAKTKIQAGAATSLNAGIIASIFGIHLGAMLEKGADGTRVLVFPTSENPRQSVKLIDICAAAGISKGVQGSIDSVLKDYLGFTGGLDGTSIDVNQAFYYYSSYEADQGEGEDAPKHEYALSLGMTNSYTPHTPAGAPFQVESITFSLWNSTRQKVTDAMGMATVEDILDKFS